MGSLASGSTRDLGEQIIEDDSNLGTSPGEIHVTASGTISEGKVSLSVGHDLVCDNNQITISLNSGSYLYQNSHTRIKNCTISSTPTRILGEVQSINTDHLELDHVTFVGGGNLVYWNGVKHFSISNNTVLSITAVDKATNAVQSGFYLLKCSHGRVTNLSAKPFVFPPGSNTTAILALNLSSDVTVTNPMINGVDASLVRTGAGAILIAGSNFINVYGGHITHNSNTDGILSELYLNTPSHNLKIIGLDSSYNGAKGVNPHPFLTSVLGDGIDLINTGHVFISHCVLRGAGYLEDQQPGVWIFIDDDVVVADSDISDGSWGGIEIAGSPNVRLLRNSIKRNQGSGVYVEWQAGTATNVGSAVTFVDGVSGGFGLSWAPGTPFIFDGTTYEVASVTDSEHLTLAVAPPDHSSPVPWGVNSTVEIVGGVIEDNGMARAGGHDQVGINWADGTTGQIYGVTVTNTGIGAQLYGLELANRPGVFLSNDNFSGNLDGGDGIDGAYQAVSSTSLLFPNQLVATTSSEQMITLTAGAVAVQNLHVQTSADFVQTNDCSRSLPPYGTCNIRIAFSPAATGPKNGSLEIIDDAPHSPQTVLLGGTAVPFGLGLAVPFGSSGTAILPPGGTTQYTLSIGGAGVSGTASLSCAGAPWHTTCDVAPTQAVSATNPASFTVSVTSTSRRSRVLYRNNLRLSPWVWAIALIGWVVLPRGRTRRPRGLLPPFLLLIMSLCSCGGGNTPRRTVILMVTARVGTASAQVPLTLTVQ